MPVRLVAAACDVDGTLADGSTISLENHGAVRRLRGDGTVVILATGRNYHHVTHFCTALELTSPVISSDGGLICVPRVGDEPEILSERPLSLAASAYILEEAHRRNVTSLCFFREGIHVATRIDWSVNMERHAEIGERFRYETVAVMSKVVIYKTLLFSSDPSRLDDLQAHVMERLGGEVDCIRNGPNTLEFVAKGVSKVTALDIVASYCGFSPADAAAFGDGINDISMFGWAGTSVCMHHGHPTAKAAARLVAPETHPGVNFAAAVNLLLG